MKFDELKLSEIADIQTGPFGSQLHKRDYVESGTPIVTVEHLGNRRFTHQNLPRVSKEDCIRLSKYSLKVGDIVFSRVGSVDRCSLVIDEDRWLFSGRCLRVREQGDKVNYKYLYYYLTTPDIKEHIRRIAVGATMPSINTSLMSNITIRFPDKNTQIKIARILSSLDDKIEVNNKINKNLEELAQTLYKQWFVDFEFPNEEGLPYKSSGGKMVDSELGLIPNGWSVSIITDIFDIQYGKYNYTKNKGSSNLTYPIYGANGIISYNDTYEHEERQIIVGCRGTCGNVSLTDEKSNITSNSLVFKSKLIPYNYFRLKSFNFSPYITGSTQPQITIKNISGIKFINPTSNLITDFSDFSFSILKKIRTIEIENKKLAETRDLLLPKLMSGEIRVPIKE